ncbi:MAG TPA: transcription termination/antitermination protein NusA [Sutterella sp.]|nr:transcription termination/antitermination protein NusA [Sutterella sp.]
MNRELLEKVESLAQEKSVPRDIVFGVLETALSSAIRKSHFPGTDADVEVVIDHETGDYRAFRRWVVVADEAGLQEPDREEMFSDICDEHPELAVGDYIRVEIEDVKANGRRFAQDAKQIILQRLRDAEREQMLEEFLKSGAKVVYGQVKRIIDKGDAIVEIGKVEARLPRSEMIPKENFRAGDKVRAYVARVDRQGHGPQVFLSRVCPEFIMELFAQQVPEIDEGLLEIKCAARDPGSRAKIAVHAKDQRLDPVGTCIGVRGTRVNAVTNELAGERVDIVLWDPEPAQFVVNALEPAKVSGVVMLEDTHTMEVVVDDEENYAVAIGLKGQNVHLATLLTGWKIEILTNDEADVKRNEETQKIREEFMGKLDLDEETADLFIQSGFSSIEEIAYVPEEELEGVGLDAETTKTIRERARAVSLTVELEREENLRTAVMALMEVPGVDAETANLLVTKGIKTVTDLADLATDELEELTGIAPEVGGPLILEARAKEGAN